jgi:hypothetical protein
MSEFIVTGPDGKRYRVTGDSPEGAAQAVAQLVGGQSETQRIADGVRARSEAQGGQAGAEARAAEADQNAMDQMLIAQRPVAARGLKFMEGVPFVGSWFDEAVGSIDPNAREQMRATSAAMDRQNPNETTALNVGGAITGSIPIALAAGPAITARAASTLGGRALQGLGLGAVTGAVEGAVYGSGREGDRLGNAQDGAMLGGVAGGALGAAAPYAAEGIKRALLSMRGTDVAAIQSSLGVSPGAARVIKNALERGDADDAVRAFQRAGDDAMLADAGQPARELLDAAANVGGDAGRIARTAVEDRTTRAAGDITRALDTHLGAPGGIETAKSGIRQGTQAARQQAYDAAYSKPINYAGPRGRTIEGLLGRVPQSAISRANELMRLEGVQSNQIMASIGKDGRVTYTRMPDVRQIDYLTRALNDVASEADGAGKMGGTTALGRATGNLSRQIRTILQREVPEYRTALNTAADAIRRTQAIDLGAELLRDTTKREAVAQGLRGMTRAEREAVKQGIRQAVDDQMANVKRTLTDTNMDAREALEGLRQFSSRSSEEKMRMVLGPRAARELAQELDRASTAFELRAAIAANSKTAIRGSIQQSVDAQTAPGMLETLGQGRPAEAGKRFVQIFTGASEEAQELRRLGIYEEIATALTQTRGASAERALRTVQRAMAGQKISEREAEFVGRTIATSGFLTGNREASRQLSTR